MKVVVIAGIPGSGSTTVLKKALEELDYLHVNYGDVMLEIAKSDWSCREQGFSEETFTRHSKGSSGKCCTKYKREVRTK